jgi:hypothetical protein
MNTRRMPSPAMVVSTVALIVALAGTAYAVTAPKNSVKTKSIKNAAVKTSKLADAAVATAKLADGAVTTPKLAEAAVSGGKLADGAVGSAKIANGAVGSEKLADGAVSSDKLASQAVTNTKIVNGAVSSGKIEPTAVTADKFYKATTVNNNFPEIAGNSCSTVQPTGYEDLIATDRIIVTYPDGLNAPLIVRATTGGADLLLTMCNVSAVAADPPTLPYRILVVR